MKLGIDASNLREGGGVTHLTELLRSAGDHLGVFDRVIVWGSRASLACLPDAPWLDLRDEPLLDGSLVRRLVWQATRLPRLAREIDLLFAPGGITSQYVRPRVVMSRNMLPFDLVERKRYGVSPTRARLALLRQAHRHSFSTADGVIFLTTYAQQIVCKALRRQPKQMTVISHGISDRFRMTPRPERTFDAASPARILYVSATSPHKHQRELVAAVASLGAKWPVTLTLAGPDDGTGYVDSLTAQIASLDPSGERLHFLGKVPFDQVHQLYRDADVFAFASSCENMPNILVEAMASGLPIACSRRGPMPEMLGDAGVYFNPDSPEDIATNLERLLREPPLRSRLAAMAHLRADAYSWDRCAAKTFQFLEHVVLGSRGA